MSYIVVVAVVVLADGMESTGMLHHVRSTRFQQPKPQCHAAQTRHVETTWDAPRSAEMGVGALLDVISFQSTSL